MKKEEFEIKRKELYALIEQGYTQAEIRNQMKLTMHMFYKLYRTDEENERIRQYRLNYLRSYDSKRTTVYKTYLINVKPLQDAKKETNERYKVLSKKVAAFKRRSDFTIDYSWREVLAIYEKEPRCQYSGLIINLFDTKDYNLDHKVPVSKGGNSNIDNLAFTKTIVNKIKYTRLPDTFVDICKKVADYQRYKEQNETIEYFI